MTDRPPLHARYGISTFESFFDIDARRHLMPSVMDYVPLLGERCACPGPKGNAIIQCIEACNADDHLCDACRAYCFGDNNGKQVRFIEHFGPAYHIVKAPAQPVPLPTVPLAQVIGEKRAERMAEILEAKHVGPVVLTTMAPPPEPTEPNVMWALNPTGRRVHAYKNRPRLVPRSLCNQSQMANWTEVLASSKLHEQSNVPTCRTCLRMANE